MFLILFIVFHMIRRNNIHRPILEGPPDGNITIGRSRPEWMTNITELMGMRDWLKIGSNGES